MEKMDSLGSISYSLPGSTTPVMMSIPQLNVNPGEVSFFLQSGLLKDSVTIEASELNLKSLKDLACNFVDRKFPDHGLNRLNERLMLFKHEYNSENMLLPVNAASDVTEGALVEIVVSGNNPSDEVQIRPHSLQIHSYKSPTFCDFCGEMLFGLVRQGLKCDGCGLNYHKRCAYKIPNNCSHQRRRRSSAHLCPSPSGGTTPTESLKRTTSSGASLTNSASNDSSLLSTSPCRDRRPSGSSSVMGRPAWVERELAGRIRVPHSFVVHSYTRPTVCQHCKKLLKGIFKQGLQCKDCKFNVHKKCMDKVPMDCSGEAPKEWSESIERDNADEESDPESSHSGEIKVTSSNEELGERPSRSVTEMDSSSNIPLMRIVQSIRQTKRRGSKVLKEGWMHHFTNKDSTLKKHFWRLDTKSISMFKNEHVDHYWKEIPLSEILAINPSKGSSYWFELKTAHVDYFCGKQSEMEVSMGWERSVRQAYMPVNGANGSVADPNRPMAIARPGCLANSVSCNIDGRGRSNSDRDISLQYQIFPDEVLGSGQFGIVYGGVHRTTSRSVAIKVIDKQRFPQTQEAQLKNEVAILQGIRHQGVVTLDKMFETPERIFVVMEKMKGDMLEMILNSEKPKGRLSERITKFLIYQILVALKYLHNMNVVHCDLKPENVLLSSDQDYPQVKLCDFGFARIIGEKSFRRSVVGTPAYLAPEVLRKKGYDRTLDMWSVGVIIYVSLSGTFPFNEDEDINDQIQNAAFMYPAEPWREISRDAIDVINHLLQVKCKKRLTVVKALLHPWMEDYQTWCDLRELEHQVGERWVTHESDDERWERYRRERNLPPPREPPVLPNDPSPTKVGLDNIENNEPNVTNATAPNLNSSTSSNCHSSNANGSSASSSPDFNQNQPSSPATKVIP